MKSVFRITFVLSLFSCSPGQGRIDTPENAANTWCDLATQAAGADGSEEKSLYEQLYELERSMDKEHQGDTIWFNECHSKIEAICPEAWNKLLNPNPAPVQERTEPLM